MTVSENKLFSYDKGIRLSGSNFWLDASRSRPFCFVSHAHSDHVRPHRKILATPATAALCRLRLRKGRDYVELEYNNPTEIEGWTITLVPAGHILGSAQLLAERNGRRLVYTGDFKTAPGLTGPPASPIETDELIMENTFGSPSYRLPNPDEVRLRMREVVEKMLGEGRPVALYAYSLGKAQEVQKIFADMPKLVHPAVAAINKIYGDFGVDLGPWEEFALDRPLAAELYISPPAWKKAQRKVASSRAYSAFISGWGADPSAKYRFGVDEVFPLSDHADYDDLIDYVKKSNPKKVYLTHGNDVAFARTLRELGFAAEPLTPGLQLDLFD